MYNNIVAYVLAHPVCIQYSNKHAQHGMLIERTEPSKVLISNRSFLLFVDQRQCFLLFSAAELITMLSQHFAISESIKHRSYVRTLLISHRTPRQEVPE